MLIDVKALKKTLRGLADLLASEAERNPAFAEALQNVLFESAGQKRAKETITLKKAPKVEVFDPFAALSEKGPVGFKEWLGTLDVPSLRAIVRQYRLDPTRLSDKWKTQGRFIELIHDRVQDRVSHGESFRNYGERKDQDAPESL